MWDAILAAGEPDGIRPFGLEPQRILRLQKQHIIVGQDTDSESTPFGAGDAVGGEARQGRGLHRQVGARARRPSIPRETALVGFTLANGNVPTEGAVVLDERGDRRRAR